MQTYKTTFVSLIAATSQSHFASVRALTGTDAATAAAAIEHLMSIIGDLQNVSVDTSAARREADRLLLYWQSRG